uniref:DDE Tnp4 domain-containing protein n=1 Tax=Sinocyclocheilus grahami TaxID=75366 RepID=A0A672R782_SINGR
MCVFFNVLKPLLIFDTVNSKDYFSLQNALIVFQTLLRVIAQHSSPSVWVHNRIDDWWKIVVPETFQVAVAVWKLATNAEYRSVAHLFGVGITTACDCDKDFCSSVETILLPEFIHMPNAEKLKELSLYFEQRWGLPQCVGAINGSHIPILAPQEFHREYFNRKGWYSIVLQAVVDGKGLFWNVFALWELAERGKLLSQQFRNVSGQEVGHYIIGDAAYTLTSWLMKPFSDNGVLTQQQEVGNHKTSKARVVVEHAFGRLKGRWRCLLKHNDCNLEWVKSMVLTGCVLHNLCESHGEEFREDISSRLCICTWLCLRSSSSCSIISLTRVRTLMSPLFLFPGRREDI